MTVATDKELYEIVGRAVVSVEFRAQLLDNPAQAAAELGYELTDEQLTALKSPDGKGLAVVLEERLPKSIGGLPLGPYGKIL